MAKFIPCPECSRGPNRYLMSVKPKREYDKELHMPIIIYTCNICMLEMRVTGVICIDCGGTGDIKAMGEFSRSPVALVKNCPYCKGWGVIPNRFVIIPGNRSRVGSRRYNNFNALHDNDCSNTSSLSTGAVGNYNYGVDCRRVITELVEDVGECISRWLRGE